MNGDEKKCRTVTCRADAKFGVKETGGERQLNVCGNHITGAIRRLGKSEVWELSNDGTDDD